MKTRILLLAMAILGSGLLYSQTNSEENSNKCEKKVLRNIQRKMNFISMNDYLKEGEKTQLIVSCTVNKDKVVEVTNLKGEDEDLKEAVIEVLQNRPVKCNDMNEGSAFTFVMKFALMPA